MSCGLNQVAWPEKSKAGKVKSNITAYSSSAELRVVQYVPVAALEIEQKYRQEQTKAK